jgi:hypothetical protein
VTDALNYLNVSCNYAGLRSVHLLKRPMYRAHKCDVRCCQNKHMCTAVITTKPAKAIKEAGILAYSAYVYMSSVCDLPVC